MRERSRTQRGLNSACGGGRTGNEVDRGKNVVHMHGSTTSEIR